MLPLSTPFLDKPPGAWKLPAERSIKPYKVTLDCAWAAVAAPRPKAARTTRRRAGMARRVRAIVRRDFMKGDSSGLVGLKVSL